MRSLSLARNIGRTFLCLAAPLSVSAQARDDASACQWKDGLPHPTLYATLVPANPSVLEADMYLATLLQETLASFRPPDTMDAVTTGVMRLRLRASGELSVAPGPHALPEPLEAALRKAVDSVSRRGGIGPVLPAPSTDSADLRLLVHWASERKPLSLPLLRLTPPPVYFDYQVDKPALPRPGNPPPKYPVELREQGIDGEVLAQFVVDKEGRADMRTFKALKESHREFTLAVRSVLPRMRFFPAEVDGCAVAQMVQLPFTFRTGF